VRLILRIRRGFPSASRYELFTLELDGSATLLDALEYLRTGLVPDLVYRHSCHHGSCGTCSVCVDGKEVLACLMRLDSLSPKQPGAESADGEGAGEPPIITVEPLAVFEPLADLAIDPGLLFRAQPEGISLLRESEPTAIPDPAAGEMDYPLKSYQFEDCIECGCCQSACPECENSGVATPTSSSEPAFMGPAALAALRRETINHPDRLEDLLERASLPDGVVACKRHLACSRVCPRAVYPAKHIELLRREITKGSPEI